MNRKHIKESHFDDLVTIFVATYLVFSPFWAVSVSHNLLYTQQMTILWIGSALLFMLSILTLHYLCNAFSAFIFLMLWIAFSYFGYTSLSPISVLAGVQLVDAQPIFVFIPLAFASNSLLIAIEYKFGMHHHITLERKKELCILAIAITLIGVGFAMHVHLFTIDGIAKKITLYSTIMVGLKLIWVLSMNRSRK